MSTWKNAPEIPITGGGTWTSYTLDPATGLLYVPVGNPGPDFAPDVREGANLFTGSVLVLDAKTGAYKNHFKLVPIDWHDWDVSNTPTLIHTQGGKHLLRSRAQGRISLWHRSSHQCRALPHPGDENRKMQMSPSRSVRLSISAQVPRAGENGTGLPTIRRPTLFLPARLIGARR